MNEHLCGNACVICAWQPQCGPVTHPCKTCHDVLQRDKHGMPHMQPAGHIGGRHGHRKWVAFACVFWLKHAVFFPPATSKSALVGTSQEHYQGAEPCLKQHAIPVIKALLSASSIEVLGQGLSRWHSTCVSKSCVMQSAVFGCPVLRLKLTFGQSG